MDPLHVVQKTKPVSTRSSKVQKVKYMTFLAGHDILCLIYSYLDLEVSCLSPNVLNIKGHHPFYSKEKHELVTLEEFLLPPNCQSLSVDSISFCSYSFSNIHSISLSECFVARDFRFQSPLLEIVSLSSVDIVDEAFEFINQTSIKKLSLWHCPKFTSIFLQHFHTNETLEVLIDNSTHILHGISKKLSLPSLKSLHLDWVPVHYSLLQLLSTVAPRLRKLFMHSTPHWLAPEPSPILVSSLQTLLWMFPCRMTSLQLPKLNTLFLSTFVHPKLEDFQHLYSYPCLRHIILYTERLDAEKALSVLTRMEHLVFLYKNASSHYMEKAVDHWMERALEKQTTHNYARYSRKDIVVGNWLPPLYQERLLSNKTVDWPACSLSNK